MALMRVRLKKIPEENREDKKNYREEVKSSFGIKDTEFKK